MVALEVFRDCLAIPSNGQEELVEETGLVRSGADSVGMRVSSGVVEVEGLLDLDGASQLEGVCSSMVGEERGDEEGVLRNE